MTRRLPELRQVGLPDALSTLLRACVGWLGIALLVSCTAATLSADSQPIITTQPMSQTVGVGQTATFTVVGSGAAPLIYQWRKNNISIAGATSASYTTPPVTQADDGTKYVVSVSNSFSGVTSNTVTLNVGTPSITMQPVSQTVGVGQTVTFTVVGAGAAPLIYQWRKNNISIAGATSASYTTPPVTQADDGAKYVVSVSNSFSGVTSNIVTLNIGNPSITTQPVSQTVGIGQTATFTVVGAGTGPLIYQWRKNNASIAGATSASYTTPPATPADDGTKYVVSVSNSFSGVTSNIVTLSVPHTATSITTQPVSQTVGIGQTATFTVVGAGTGPLIYQWRKNNASIAGATSASYTTPPATPADDGTKYVVSVSNSFSGVTSNIVTLSVPHTATSITTQPVSQTVGIGQTATFTVVGAGTGPLTYQWRKNNISIAGATSASYTTPPATQTDGGTKYVVSVSNSFSGVTSNIVTLNIGNPSITTQPVSQTVGIGQTATFTVVGGGAAPFIYQWTKNNVFIPGATSASYTTPPVTQADDGANYVVSVSNSFSGVTSNTVTLNIGTPSITTQPVSRTVGVGQTATFTVVGSGAAPLIYQWRKNNISIAGATSVSYTTPPVTQADDGTKYVVSVSNSFSGVTSNTVTLNVGTPSITTQPVSPTVGVGQTATFTVVGAGAAPLIYQWRKNNISIAGATSASYTTPAVTQADNGAKYVVSVSNSFSGVTSNTVTLNVRNLSITTQPVSQTVILGDTVTFTVAAIGTAPLSYQWEDNGRFIFGATSSSYSTVAAIEDDGAEVTVVVSNLAGSVTSEPAILTLFIPATIVAPPKNQTVAVGEAATFSVQARGTLALSYQWQRRARGEAIAQDIPGAASPNYIRSAVTAADQGSEYTVRVRDTQGNAALASATLTVTPTSPAIYYVDYLTGDDTNDGTAQSAPWRHAPGMHGCADLCLITTLNPGDQIIFKGGITWDSHAFPMNITRSGTSGAPIYYGVDKTWFAGLAWVRPIFDLTGTVFSDSPVVSSADFVTVDNIEIRNARLDNLNQWPTRGNITIESGTNVTIQNCYIHGWSAANPLPGSAATAGIAFFDDAPNGTVEKCTLDGSPVGATVSAIYGGKFIRDNIIQNVPNAVVILSDEEDVEISGNRIFNIRHSSDQTQTENGIVVWGSARIYDNVIHDLFSGATAVSLQSFSFETDINQYVYNNLVWNIGSNAAVRISLPGGIGSNQFIYNNTIQAGATGCVQFVPGPFVGGNLTVENNHCISDQSSLPAWCWNGAEGNSNCGPVGATALQTNTLMTTATAVSQGYTIASSFQPSSTASGTVGAGTNLTAQCSSAGPALCSDRLAVTRPAAAWDTGAYFFGVASGLQAPLISQEPASRIVVAGQTGTFSTVATGAPTVTYQWRRNGADIAGATANSYTTPSASAADDGAEFMVIVSNGSGTVQSGVAILSVRDAPGRLISSASTVDFGDVYVGITKQTELAFTNNGQLEVAIANVSVAGAGIQASGVPTGTILSPGQTATMRLTFSPFSTGNMSGSITVTSDAADSPLTVSLAGNGVAVTSHAVILSWIASASDLTGYRVYRRTNPAGAYVLINGGVQPTTNYADLAVSPGQTYFYAVTAVDANDVESDYSNLVQAIIPMP